MDKGAKANLNFSGDTEPGEKQEHGNEEDEDRGSGHKGKDIGGPGAGFGESGNEVITTDLPLGTTAGYSN